jgi:hypothetical protein
VPDVREPHSKWLQDASPASGSVERFSSEWLPLLAAVPAHWSQSSLHGSGFDPFICEKFSRARHALGQGGMYMYTNSEGAGGRKLTVV